ncbi:GspE/PulE family protein [Pseudomonas viridiflava]|uniref:GspE/PulE family protein n=1 Tax=Pseudomonas viridiflava TaxID=33069 RepID=UPI000F03CF4B|nr:ATPase, T2SS/T4P/T4SS family [Pseudomonas viridiflava]
MSNLAVIEVQPVTTLSGPGERLEVDDHLRGVVCLTSDNIVHVVNGYAADPHVLAYIARVSRLVGSRPGVEYVTPEEVQKLYGATKLQSTSRVTQPTVTSGKGKHEQVVELLRKATSAGASDMHIVATPKGHEVRFRVHGSLERIENFAGDDGQSVMSAIYETMCEKNKHNYRPGETQDGRLKSDFVTECGLFGARISTRPSLNGPGMVMRLLYDSGKRLTLEEQGWLPSQIEAFDRLIHRNDGMVYLTGTTGSGKSTNMQGLLSMLLSAMDYRISLVTVEDPVEYRIEGANQTPLGPQESWAQAIRNLMRQDPDVIMVGEVRDSESVLAAFQAALTGHGTWSTLHVNSAAASFQRLSDLGVHANLLHDAALVKGLVNQSLTRILCEHCKVPYLELRHLLDRTLAERVDKFCIPEAVHLVGEGCSHCEGRGVVNRAAIGEIILPNLEFMRKMREHGKPEAQVYWVNEQGGITKNAHLLHRINQGVVDPRHGERDVCPLDEDQVTLGKAGA